MPYKDPKSPEARNSQHARYRRWYEKNKEIERQKSRDAYWENPEAERERNKIFKNQLAIEKRCVNCGKERDRGNKVLCSACVPIHAESVKASHRKVKDAAFNAYGGPICSCCGDTHFEFLSIHHVKGGGADHRKELGGGGLKVYFWLKRNNYPPGFAVLCHNCNQSRGCFGYCPHERERLDAAGVTVSSQGTQ